MSIPSRIIVLLAAALVACAPLSRPAAAPAAAQSLDGPAMAQLGREIAAGRYGNIHALLVLHRGRVAYEHYFTGADERRGQPIGNVAFDANTLHDARSVTKSVVSILFGLAVAEGRIPSLDTPVLDFFPEFTDLRTPERLRIRLRDLLTMSSGLEWDESSRPYGDPANSETAMDAAANPYRYALDRPIAAPPGTRWVYNGGSTLLLAGVIERATAMPLDRFAERALFRPLGISRHEWYRYPSGTPIAASGLRLRPRDMLKIGRLYLDGGRWRGRQLVPEPWVRDSLAAQVHISDRPLGLRDYGYHWFVGTGQAGGRDIPYNLAVGWGGQRIMLIPSLEMAIVVTAGMYGDRRQTDLTFELMLDGVLPALR